MVVTHNVTSILHDKLRDPPIITAGHISVSVANNWHFKCEQYFHHTKIAKDNHVGMVIYNMCRTDHQDWLANCAPQLLKMDFNGYIDAFHMCWLPRDWEHTTHCELLSLTQGSRPFLNFQEEFITKNGLLMDTVSHLDDNQIKHQLGVSMDKDLVRNCSVEKTYLVDDLQDWLDAVQDLDEKQHHQIEKLNHELMKRNPGSTCSAPCNVFSPGSMSNSHSGGKSATDSADVKEHPLKLSPKEHELLDTHHGCYVCHQFYVYHYVKECKNRCPEGTDYKVLTLDATIKVKKSAVPLPGNAKLCTVTSITMPSGDDEKEDSSDNEDHVVCTILPSCVADAGDFDSNDGESPY
ncbi:hypothetical protein BDN71DRAFT_1432166 [Pleurotus eryngii]|uniref:Uncharacterized protein n=1 Tax=Pleurotus eryngii TaxID=5323 RepID=A0A9P5ZUY3_PLEER|nr:hypothetical protein BDN71DRAFT_1432166 [Pleurotus eryngii]